MNVRKEDWNANRLMWMAGFERVLAWVFIAWLRKNPCPHEFKIEDVVASINDDYATLHVVDGTVVVAHEEPEVEGLDTQE